MIARVERMIRGLPTFRDAFRNTWLPTPQVQGRDLLPMDSTLLGKATTADPFVKVRLAGTADRFQVCRHVPKTLRPWWNAEFRVPLPLAAAMADGASLELVVEDYDMLSKNDFMGKALIPLAGLEDKKTRRAWYALGDEQGRQRVIRRRFDSSVPRKPAREIRYENAPR